MSAFLLATVNSARVQAGVTPVKEVDQHQSVKYFLVLKNIINNQRRNISAHMHLKYSQHLSAIPSTDAIHVHARTGQR